MWNHRSYRNNLMLTSLFALFTFGAYFTGLQQGRSSVRPEIRSSNTPIVQVDRSATTRLQAQVAQDGGSIEAPAVTPEQPAVEEERSDASTDEPAPEPEPPTVEEVEVEEPETPVVEDEVELGPEDMSSDLDLPEDLPTNTDEISGTDDGNEDAPEEPTLEEELTGGEQANQNLQEIADNIYGAGDRVDAYLRENLGNGAGTVVSSPVRLVTGLGGLVTQGTGYVAEGAYDYVLAPIGRGATGAWNYFFGDDSNEDSDEDTPAEEPKVEEERSDAPTVENAPEAEASAVERPMPDNTGAEDGSAPAEPAEEGNWFTRGADAVGDFFTETIPEVAEDAWDATTGAVDEYVVQPVQDLFNGDSDEDTSVEEPTVEEERSDAPTAEPPAPETPTADGQGEQAQSEEPWYKAAWNGFTGFFGFGSDDNTSQKPTDDKPAGLNGQEPPVLRTVSPTGAREQAPATPDMTQLTEFLKSKGLSDADIQTAVSLARGQTPQAPTPTAERPAPEVETPAPAAETAPAPAPEVRDETPTAEAPAPAPEVSDEKPVEEPAPAPEADVSTSPADNAPEVEAPAPAPESSAGSLKDNLGALQQGQVPPEMKRYLQSIGLSEDEINRGWRHMHQQMQQQTPEQRQQKLDQGEIIRRRLEARGLSQSAIAAEVFRFHGGLLDEAKSAEYANLVSNYRLVSSNPLYSFTGKDTSGLSITINGEQDNRRLVYVGPNPVLRNAPRGSNRQPLKKQQPLVFYSRAVILKVKL